MQPTESAPASFACCRATFDIDNIDIGPERRAYLETKLERVWEINSEGSIPWVSLANLAALISQSPTVCLVECWAVSWSHPATSSTLADGYAAALSSLVVKHLCS